MGSTTKPSDKTPQQKLEQAVAILQDCGKEITLLQLWRILASIRVRYVLASVVLLGSLAGGSYTLGLQWSQAPEEEIETPREQMEGLLEFDATYAHTETSKWMVALVKYLDSSDEFFVTRVESKPFSASHRPFKLAVEPNIAGTVVGVAFKFRPANPEPFMQPLVVRQVESHLEVVVPPSDKGEKLVLVLRLRRPTDEVTINLNRVVTLRVLT